MNDVAELKRYIGVHARAQRIRPARFQAVLDRIQTDADGEDGSWVREWSREGDLLAQQGQDLDAYRFYNIARFPYVDGPARAEALRRCVEAFNRHAARLDIQPLELDLPQGRIRCWTTGLSGTEKLPVLLLSGGIVSIKEQWAPVLTRIRRQGMAGVVVEMPGVGENPLRYDAESPAMISALLDAIGDRADTRQTYALALSFSGHLALRCAVTDERIRGVVTSGAPINAFFTDDAWQRAIPRVTLDTLAHLAGVAPAEVPALIRPWALSAGELEALRIPLAYLVSRRDEIIPPAEAAFLRGHVADLRLSENDDVHGSPAHVTESGLWAVSNVLRMRGITSPQTFVINTLLHVLRARPRRAAAAHG